MRSSLLERIVKLIATSDEMKMADRRLLYRFILKRVLIVQGITGLVILLKLKRIITSKSGFFRLRGLLRNNCSLVLLSTVYPILERILPDQIPHKDILSWSTTILSSLLMVTKVPSWLVTYVTVESASQYLYLSGYIRRLISGLEERTLVVCRQAILCALIPFLYVKSKNSSSSSGAAKILFSDRSFPKDFVLFFSVWNFLSLYAFGKSLLLKNKRDKPEKSNRSAFINSDDGHIRSSNMKPLMDKLVEIHEIAVQDKRSFFEIFMNTSIVKNLVPCIKWAIWRQICYKILVHVPGDNRKSEVNTKFMQSVTMMLTFYVLDGQQSKMNIRPGIIRYLIRCIMNSVLKMCPQNVLKKQLFTMSQLAFFTERSDSRSSIR